MTSTANGGGGQYEAYATSGANPFSSVNPSGGGMFPRLEPREFPSDDPPAGVPEMEQLPDPNALPDPGYPVMAGYPQAFPPSPYGGYGGFGGETAAFPVEDHDSGEDTSTFRMPVPPPVASPALSSPGLSSPALSSPAPFASGPFASAPPAGAGDPFAGAAPVPVTPPAPGVPMVPDAPGVPIAPQASYQPHQQPRYPTDPYTAPRSPGEAPPLRPGNPGQQDTRQPEREEEAAPPLSGPGSGHGAGYGSGPDAGPDSGPDDSATEDSGGQGSAGRDSASQDPGDGDWDGGHGPGGAPAADTDTDDGQASGPQGLGAQGPWPYGTEPSEQAPAEPSAPAFHPAPADQGDQGYQGYREEQGYQGEQSYQMGQGYQADQGYQAPADQTYANPGYPGQAYPDQGYPGQGYPGYPGQAPADQAQAGQAYAGQAYAGQPGAPVTPSVPGVPDQIPGVPDPGTGPSRETAESLTSELLLHGRRATPGAGWRRTLYKASGGLIHVGESVADLRRRDLVNRARTPVAGGHHRVAVMSLKGGVGKTTTAVGLGSTLASLRGDRVIAMDANPDRGTLSDKVRLETSATVRDLLNERAQVTRYADVRAFTSQAPSRLEILASDRDPAVSVAFSADDYRAVSRVLEHYYSISITDCGTGLLHSAMSGILELADHIVLVSSPSVDGARSASATLDWLEAHGYDDLVRSAVVVLSTIRPRSKSTVDLDRLEQHFASRSRAVVRIPYDAHLEEGAEFELERLDAEATDAYLELGALIGDGFAMPRRPASRATLGMPFA
jgi:MinD-like ATPase involved in chromosome partitioning or flagellar assembly